MAEAANHIEKPPVISKFRIKAWFKKENLRISPYLPQYKDWRFWLIQGIILIIAGIHAYVEVSGDLSHLGALYILPISIFFVPVIYSALLFGLRGSIATVIWIVFITIPNWVFWHQGLERIGVIFQMVVFIAVAYFVGVRVDREASARRKAEAAGAALKNYVVHVVSIQEKERQRIARELHDQTIQMMVFLCRQLDSLAIHETLPATAGEKLNSAQEISEKVVQSLRSFAKDLRPPALDDLGITYSINKYLLDFSDRTGIKSHLKVVGEEKRISSEIEIGFFRIMQEALRNIERHARARDVIITLFFGINEIRMEIKDNGAGFNLPLVQASLTVSDHFGLVGMQERAELFGGKFDVHSQPGQGTLITVSIPMQRNVSADISRNNISP